MKTKPAAPKKQSLSKLLRSILGQVFNPQKLCEVSGRKNQALAHEKAEDWQTIRFR